MAAAALGNTFSDVMGIGSAWYVESLAAKVGMKPPSLSPVQLNMNVSRWAANGVSKNVMFLSAMVDNNNIQCIYMPHPFPFFSFLMWERNCIFILVFSVKGTMHWCDFGLPAGYVTSSFHKYDKRQGQRCGNEPSRC